MPRKVIGYELRDEIIAVVVPWAMPAGTDGASSNSGCTFFWTNLSESRISQGGIQIAGAAGAWNRVRASWRSHQRRAPSSVHASGDIDAARRALPLAPDARRADGAL